MKKFTKNKIKFSKLINKTLEFSMKLDKNMICYGLGINDPKAVFGTTENLFEKFGKKRVFDVPTSENALTGVAIGAGINGVRSVTTHQRLDFFLLAMDQIVNSASKWHYMFDGKMSVPITIRLIVGRGWGQGPTHSQSLQSWFAHIPGLKVVMPSLPDYGSDLLYSSIFDPNPVLFIEHRWLHNIETNKKSKFKSINISSAQKVKTGRDITIVSMSYLTIEAIEVAKQLQKYGILCEIIDLVSVNPIDYVKIYKSVSKTKHLLVLDTSFPTCSIASEIVASVAKNLFGKLKKPPEKLTMPNFPVPTSFNLTKEFYVDKIKILLKIIKILDLNPKLEKNLFKTKIHDIPDSSFKGPF